MKKLVQVALVLAAVAGCAELKPILADALAVVSHDSEVLSTAQALADTFFIASPNPARQAQVNTAIVRARLALAAATKALRGTDALTDRDVNNALNEFRGAYYDLLTLLQNTGIVQKEGQFAAAGGKPVLPPALALERFSTKR